MNTTKNNIVHKYSKLLEDIQEVQKYNSSKSNQVHQLQQQPILISRQKQKFKDYLEGPTENDYEIKLNNKFNQKSGMFINNEKDIWGESGSESSQFVLSNNYINNHLQKVFQNAEEKYRFECQKNAKASNTKSNQNQKVYTFFPHSKKSEDQEKSKIQSQNSTLINEVQKGINNQCKYSKSVHNGNNKINTRTTPCERPIIRPQSLERGNNLNPNKNNQFNSYNIEEMNDYSSGKKWHQNYLKHSPQKQKGQFEGYNSRNKKNDYDKENDPCLNYIIKREQQSVSCFEKGKNEKNITNYSKLNQNQANQNQQYAFKESGPNLPNKPVNGNVQNYKGNKINSKQQQHLIFGDDQFSSLSGGGREKEDYQCKERPKASQNNASLNQSESIVLFETSFQDNIDQIAFMNRKSAISSVQQSEPDSYSYKEASNLQKQRSLSAISSNQSQNKQISRNHSNPHTQQQQQQQQQYQQQFQQQYQYQQNKQQYKINSTSQLWNADEEDGNTLNTGNTQNTANSERISYSIINPSNPSTQTSQRRMSKNSSNYSLLTARNPTPHTIHNQYSNPSKPITERSYLQYQEGRNVGNKQEYFPQLRLGSTNMSGNSLVNYEGGTIVQGRLSNQNQDESHFHEYNQYEDHEQSIYFTRPFQEVELMMPTEKCERKTDNYLEADFASFAQLKKKLELSSEQDEPIKYEKEGDLIGQRQYSQYFSGEKRMKLQKVAIQLNKLQKKLHSDQLAYGFQRIRIFSMRITTHMMKKLTGIIKLAFEIRDFTNKRTQEAFQKIKVASTPTPQVSSFSLAVFLMKNLNKKLQSRAGVEQYFKMTRTLENILLKQLKRSAIRKWKSKLGRKHFIENKIYSSQKQFEVIHHQVDFLENHQLPSNSRQTCFQNERQRSYPFQNARDLKERQYNY